MAAEPKNMVHSFVQQGPVHVYVLFRFSHARWECVRHILDRAFQRTQALIQMFQPALSTVIEPRVQFTALVSCSLQ
jgi:hypothetical protein